MRVRTTAALLGLGVLLAGCGGEATSPRGTTVTVTASGPTAVPGSVSEGTLPAKPSEPAGPEVIAPADPASFRNSGGPVAFISPTGNVHCTLGDKDYTAGCQAEQAPVPAGAEKSCAGNEMYPASMLNRGFHILGDRIEPSCFNQGVYVTQDARALAYGTSVTANGITCTSRTTGITCVTSSGRGFVLSMQEARAF